MKLDENKDFKVSNGINMLKDLKDENKDFKVSNDINMLKDLIQRDDCFPPIMYYYFPLITVLKKLFGKIGFDDPKKYAKYVIKENYFGYSLNNVILSTLILAKRDYVLAFLKGLLEVNPDLPINMTIGDMYKINGDYENAIKYYQKANEESFLDFFEHCHIYLADENLKKARLLPEEEHITLNDGQFKEKKIDKKTCYSNAIAFLSIAGKYGSILAYNLLGHMYYEGTDVEKNLDQAKTYLEKAIALGEFEREYRPYYDRESLSHAYNNLGCILVENSKTDSDDYLKGIEYLKISGSLGFTQGYYNLGIASLNAGKEAEKWFSYAADDGNEMAAKELAMIKSKKNNTDK